MKYTVKSKVWVYPGMAAWRFVHISKQYSDDIRARFGTSARGWGSIKVKVVLGATTWETSIFPDKQSGTYLLPLKASVRRAEGIDDDDTITFELTVVRAQSTKAHAR